MRSGSARSASRLERGTLRRMGRRAQIIVLSWKGWPSSPGASAGADGHDPDLAMRWRLLAATGIAPADGPDEAMYRMVFFDHGE
jgi:hypothetical protein